MRVRKKRERGDRGLKGDERAPALVLFEKDRRKCMALKQGQFRRGEVNAQQTNFWTMDYGECT